MRQTTAQLVAGLIGIAFLISACQSGSLSSVSPAATPTPASTSALLVFTTWVADPNVTNGPEPGYKPALTGLTGHDIQTATAAIDASGTTWIIDISFTPRGANLFAQLTRDNVSACAGDPNIAAGANCAGRHLAVWFDLTQADIDAWENANYAARVSQLYDLACLAVASPGTVCSKFLADPITLEPITGGRAQLPCGCSSEQDAKKLAA